MNNIENGLWEYYHTTGELWFKTFFKNDEKVGYSEYYNYGVLLQKTFSLI